ncbi:hypothetical protein Cyast_1635 [Cyanobacterium stanieri PCC 7202]|uniref:Uncharacterized protein n=1 Tax=Cyanobacterium stanieri (strain ATCC 29140 / PCC 7202) TaxID=292563 RepID=K9YKX5_CYASC|nr:hypothetical protein Cyast_1635 [Cyanobacterium stanieri PCC 7202]
MEYVDIFERIEGDLSDRVKDLQKKQQELLEQKKFLTEAKQRIHGFLSDAHEIRQVLEFHPSLIEVVRGELDKIFAVNSPSHNLQLPKAKGGKIPDNSPPQSKEVEVNLPTEGMKKPKDPEKIKFFPYVNMEGKTTRPPEVSEKES